MGPWHSLGLLMLQREVGVWAELSGECVQGAVKKLSCSEVINAGARQTCSESLLEAGGGGENPADLCRKVI